MAVNMKSTAFWAVTPCSLEKSWCFIGTCHLHLQGQKIVQETSRSRWQTANCMSKNRPDIGQSKSGNNFRRANRRLTIVCKETQSQVGQRKWNLRMMAACWVNLKVERNNMYIYKGADEDNRSTRQRRRPKKVTE
jgi:hypothetical protein